MDYLDPPEADLSEIDDGEAAPAPRRKGMRLEELATILAGEIESAKEADRTTYMKDRQRALEYYLGEMPDTAPPPNRSKAMSRDVADTVDWMLPGLMRIFFAGDKIVDYLPARPGDEEFASQATEYVNFLVTTRCNGYEVLWDAFWNALVMRVGIVKFFWDDTACYTTENYTGLSDDALAAVMAEDEFGDTPEIIEQETTETLDEMTGEMVVSHDIKLKRTLRKGDIKIESVPPEEFLIDSDATSIEDARFLCHRTTRTRSDLVREGFPRRKIDELPTYQDSDAEEEAIARQDEFVQGAGTSASHADRANEEIQVYECYAAVDMDGDGIAEWTRTLLAGGFSEDNILAHEEWGDPIPFADLVPARIPHRWQGRSIADQTVDIQQIKTVLFRNTLDNVYENQNRQREVVESQVVNMDEVVSPTFGGIIRVKQPNVVRWDTPQFLAPEMFQMMSYLDDIIEKRTGVSRATAALDPEALQNQTATATQLGHDNRYSKIELVARNFAEGGLKRLFAGILKLVVSHQDRPEIIRLRDTFVEMDPRAWNAEMDVSVNIGLGAGSRDRDLAMLNSILGYQREILAAFGPTNPFVTVKHLYNTLDQIIATAGLKHTEQFFAELSDEDVKAYVEQQKQGQQDPKAQAAMQKAQADVQLAQMKAQADVQMKGQELQQAAQIKQQELQTTMQMRQAEFDAEMAMKREEMQARLQMAREEMQMKHDARLKEMMMEYDLRRLQLANPAIPAHGDQSNLPRA